jgi:hypothetical protein
MLALYRAGRQAEALQSYHDARHILVEELGVEPGPALQQLYRSILRQERGLQETPPHEVQDHIGDVAKALLTGRLVIVLGPGAGQGDGPGEAPLPSSGEVVAHLAKVFEYPFERARDLAHVAEWVAVAKGAGPLYDELHTLFERDAAPSPIHHALAELSAAASARAAPPQLLLTTGFDRLLERAFAEADQPLDVVLYLAFGRHRGKFLHIGADGRSTVVEVPNTYTDVSGDWTVLFKINGGVDPQREWESFVVSEDDYIDYLAQAEISVVLPVTLAARLRRSHFLFLGYQLEEWNLRVFLHRMFGREKVSYRSWAVGSAESGIDRELWRQRGIDTLEVPVEDYLTRLRERVEAEAGG